jgi:hypothetical protein
LHFALLPEVKKTISNEQWEEERWRSPESMEKGTGAPRKTRKTRKGIILFSSFACFRAFRGYLSPEILQPPAANAFSQHRSPKIFLIAHC